MFVSSKIVAIVSAIALAASAGVASAAEFQSNGRTVEVRHGDLDLSTEAGQKQLRHRISRAASAVCIAHDLAVSQACRAKAIAQVSAPIKAAIARAQTGERYADAGVSGMTSVAGN